MNIRLFNHNDDELWSLVGRFFADRAVRRALGGPLSSDTNYQWWIALNEQQQVMGFAGAELRKAVMTLHHAYVMPEHRKAGVYAALLESRLVFARDAGCSTIRATCTAMSRNTLIRRGFVVTGSRGQYATVALNMMTNSEVRQAA